MKLSIWSTYYYPLSPEEAVDRLYRNGITASELSDEHGLMLLERSEDIYGTAEEFAAFLKERNFEMTQGHLWLRIKICSDETALEKLYRWVDLYEAIGIRNMVLHCDNLVGTTLTKEEKVALNVAKLKRLAEHIRGRDVTICLENLRPHSAEEVGLVDETADDLLSIIEQVGSPNFGICLDTGHLNLTVKNQREFILKAGDKLKALHIADNEGARDQHMMPFTRGKVDFVEVMQALRDIGYEGLFNLEIPGENKAPMELRDAKIAYVQACYNYLMKQAEDRSLYSI